MAGRDLDKLKSVRDATGAPADIPLIVTDASSRASLEAMINQTRLVISTVGPYQFYGSDLLAGCAATGTDYIDLCGEPIWIRRMIDAHDAAAKASGARILFSCGFDSLPFELGVFFCEDAARKAWGVPAPRIKARIRHATLSLSGGTYASTKASFVAATRDLSLVASLKDPFVLTPGSEGPKQPAGNKIAFDEELNFLVRSVSDVDNQHSQRPSLEYVNGISLRERLRLRRDDFDGTRRTGPHQRKDGDGCH
jgi:short subunit dehydrogenase-like uncharacterized protein